MVTNCQELVTKLAVTLPKCSLSVVTHLLSLQTHCQQGDQFLSFRKTKYRVIPVNLQWSSGMEFSFTGFNPVKATVKDNQMVKLRFHDSYWDIHM